MKHRLVRDKVADEGDRESGAGDGTSDAPSEHRRVSGRLSRTVSAFLDAGWTPFAMIRGTASKHIRGAAASPGQSAPVDYFVVAATPRFRATQRTVLRDSSRHGMSIVIGAALLDCLWLVPLHPEAAGLLVSLNVTVAAVAGIAYIGIKTWARRHPVPIVLVTLVVVDVATVAVGIVHPEFGILTSGYLLLLPPVVALVMMWPTSVHIGWLTLHAAAVVGYATLAPGASFAGGSRGDIFTLLAVVSVVSLFGHLAAVRARVLSFVQIERIRALNRQARRDESRLDRLNGILEQATRTDELTGLKNRLSLKLDLGVIRARITRHHERYAVLVLDLDRFKAINDQLGHVAGDRVLRAVAAALSDAARAGDGVYRYGGEEFVVLSRVGGPDEGTFTAHRLRNAIADLRIAHPANPPHGRVTLSVGVATIGPEDLLLDVEEWISRADAALYRAKANGRNAIEIEHGRSRPDADLASA